MIENRISILMGARRMGITDLAREAGVAYNTAYGLYRGTTRRIDFDTVEKLCRFFGCGVGDLLVYRPDETPAQDEPAGQPAADRPS